MNARAPASTPLAGKHALITGAGRGIGRAIAIALAENGATVTLWARTESQLRAVADTIGPHARLRCIDVRDSIAVQAAVAPTLDAGGPLDILVNNAGAVVRGPALACSDADWRDMFAANVDSTFYLTRAFGPSLRAQSGRIINIASIAGRQGTAALAAYCAAKHAVVGFTRALALELAGQVSVNAICPGSVDTDMLQQGLPGATPAMTPNDIAATALFLAATAPRALTGACLDVFG